MLAPIFRKQVLEGGQLALPPLKLKQNSPGPSTSVGDGQDRVFYIARAAINEALTNAGIIGDSGNHHMANAGLYISSAIGPISTMEAIVRDIRSIGSNDAWRAFSFGRIASRLAKECGFGGPYVLLPTGCAGGCDSVGYGLAAIRSGVSTWLWSRL